MVRLLKEQVQKLFNKHSFGLVKTVRRVKVGVSNPVFFINDEIILRIRKDSNKGKFEKERFIFDLIL